MSVASIRGRLRRYEDAMSGTWVLPSNPQFRELSDDVKKLIDGCNALAEAVELCCNELERMQREQGSRPVG
jgi:hypothetical protein